MIVELPEQLEVAIKEQARAQGVTPEGYIREVLGRELRSTSNIPGNPFKTGYGLLAPYGPAPSAEEIDANRFEMFQGFGENA